MKSLIPYLKKHKKQIIFGTVFVLFSNAFGLINPKVIGLAVDSLQEGIGWRALGLYAALIVGLSIVAGYFRFLTRQTMIVASRQIEYELRNDLFTHLLKLPLSFYHQINTGDVMARATNDLNMVRSVLGPGIMYSINTIFTAIIAIALMIYIDLRLTLLTLSIFPVISLTVKVLGKNIHKRSEEVQAHFSTINTMVQENISGIRVVKAYTQEKNQVNKFKHLASEYVTKNMSLAKIQAMFMPLLHSFFGLGVVVILWVGGRGIIAGRITLGDFVAFNVYLGMLAWPMIALGWVVNIFQRGAASMGRINRIMILTPEIKDTDNTLELDDIDGEIEFRNASFGYNGGKQKVLNSINLRIEKGKTVAIVGRTGTGKTSLINLIPRLYDVTEGELLIDRIPIQRIPLKVLRSNIGYVPQETFLFSDTIRENITFGIENHDEEIIQESAIISQLYQDVIHFPLKYDTILGEKGINLSGGQKQRTAISRATIRKPKILILDDSLSSVDTHTEEEILTRLRKIMSDRTSIIVSHRISTVKDADLIIVLDEGSIVERGTHDELLLIDGIYADLYQKQLLEEELAVSN